MTDRYQGGQSNDGTIVIPRDVNFPKMENSQSWSISQGI
jgi:hypothetical protein